MMPFGWRMRLLSNFFVGGGIATSLTSLGCCVTPVVLGAIGVTGATSSALEALTPYQTPLRAASVLMLGAAFWFVYGHQRITNGQACTVAAPRRATKVALWIGAAVVGLVIASPWWEQLIA